MVGERAGFDDDKVPEVGRPGQVSQHYSLLYLPQCNGGLNLPSPSSLYQRLEVLRQCQLITSADPTVRLIAEENLKVRDGKQEEEVLSSNSGSRSNDG